MVNTINVMQPTSVLVPVHRLPLCCSHNPPLVHDQRRNHPQESPAIHNRPVRKWCLGHLYKTVIWATLYDTGIYHINSKTCLRGQKFHSSARNYE